MSIDLQRIRIERLFDAYNLDVPIQDNTLILVGENGSGKSTLINLLYYTLTTQWDRLSQLPFHSCIVTIGNQDYTIKREDLPTTQNPKRLSSLMRYFHQRLSSQEFDSLINELADHDSEYWLSKKQIPRIKA